MKRLIAALLVGALLCPLAGCWDHLEISKMLIVAGIGLDRTAGGELYHATVEIINVQTDGNENITAELVEGWGTTLHAAVQDATGMTGGVLFGNHCKVIVLGEGLAESGITSVVEAVLRSPQYRKTVELLVAKGSTAAQVLQSQTVNNDIVSYELAAITQSNADTLRTTIPTGVYQLHESLVSPCSYAVVPAVSVRSNNGGDVLEVDGCAVLSGDRLRGYLDGDEARLLGLLLHGAQGITVQAGLPGVPAPLDLQLDKGLVTLRGSAQNGTHALTVSLALETSLREAVVGALDLTDRRTISDIEQATQRRLESTLTRLIAKVQEEFGADVFQFHRVFQDIYRHNWDALARDWDAYFRALDVTVSCTVKLTGSGLIGNYTPHDSSSEGGNALP